MLKMKLSIELWMLLLMGILSGIVTYISMTFLLRKNITYSHTKLYMVLYMEFQMVAIECLLLTIFMKEYRIIFFAIFAITQIISLIFVYLIRQQVGVDERDFARAMIEHHEMAIEMSKQLQEKYPNSVLTPLLTNIQTSQDAEIQELKNFLVQK